MNKQTTKKRPHAPSVTQVASTLRAIKRSGIDDDYRAFEEDDIPGIQVTLGCDLDHRDHWAIQTGDNSFTGSAYGFAYWGVSGLYRRTNCRELAKELIEQVVEQWWGSQR